MQKRSYLTLALVFSLILFASVLVYAEGSSTGGSSSSGSVKKSATTTSSNNSSSANRTPDSTSSVRNCELYSTRQLRVKCRIEAQREINLDNLNITEESCRTVKNQSRCALLYAQVRSCYDKSGVTKDQCFKRIAGFVKNNVKEERNSAALRAYMVFVLYNLQDKVEDAYNDKKITSDDAAQLIDQIVIVKQVVMNDGNKAQIRPSFDELKRLWQATMK
jgi:hypothetical protein